MPAKGFSDPEKVRFWRQTFHEFERTDVSGMEFCRSRQLKYAQFYSWRQRIRELDQLGLGNTELTDEQWVAIIEAARKDPVSVAAYLEAHNISSKAYYKRFIRLRKSHPEWNPISRFGKRKRSIKAENERKNSEPSKSPEFVPVTVSEKRTIDSPAERASDGHSSIEIILPNSIVLRANQDCSIDFLSSLLTVLGGQK